MLCRLDNMPIEEVFLDLGFTPPSNSFLTKEQLTESEAYFPLRLYVNPRNFLVQVDEYKKANEIFCNDYAYFSSCSTSWLKHAEEYVEKMCKRFHYNEQSQVVEIASNDGYLLQYFQKKNVPVLGVEPSRNVAEVAMEKGIKTLVRFFGLELANELKESGCEPDLILGNNVFAHVPDINDFVKGLKVLLKADGVITLEFPSLMRLIDETQFDTIYQEHFSYFSFYSVQLILKKHGLAIFDVEELPTHGGSLRIYAKHEEDTSRDIKNSVHDLLKEEISRGMTDIAYYSGFQEKVNSLKNEFLSFLLEQQQAKKKVIAYGAAAKGNTLLNYCGIKKDLIQFVVDISSYKQGKYLPGSHIPVVSEEAIRHERPDYIVILPWNLKNEITEQLSYVREWGCKFVVAIPTLTVF